LELKRSETALIVNGGVARGAAVREALPLEVKSMNDFDPRYRSPLNVQGGEEMPSLPLSVNGALAMARGAEDGTSDPTQAGPWRCHMYPFTSSLQYECWAQHVSRVPYTSEQSG